MIEVRITMDDGKTWHELPSSSYSHVFDIGANLSPFMQPYLMRLHELEIAEQRRLNEEHIASAMGIPAELLFNPMVQRLISGTLSADKMRAFVASLPAPSKRRKARRAHKKRIRRR